MLAPPTVSTINEKSQANITTQYEDPPSFTQTPRLKRIRALLHSDNAVESNDDQNFSSSMDGTEPVHLQTESSPEPLDAPPTSSNMIFFRGFVKLSLNSRQKQLSAYMRVPQKTCTRFLFSCTDGRLGGFEYDGHGAGGLSKSCLDNLYLKEKLSNIVIFAQS